MANWEELPQDLLKLIAQRLAIEDFVAFGAVCTSWLSAATKETYDAKSKAPWLVTIVCQQMPEICSLSRGRTYPMDSWGTEVMTLSPPGWLLAIRTREGRSYMAKEYRIFNPLSRASIKPPNLEKLRDSRVRPPMILQRFSFSSLISERIEMSSPKIERMALSSSPSLSRSYAVMISLYRECRSLWLAFYRLGEDAWREVSPATHPPLSSMHPPLTDVVQLIYYDGLFVALDTENQVTTLNESESRMELRLVLEPKFEGYPYLVECSGSLLVAWDTAGTEGNRFRVFHVDLEKGTQEEVKSLGKASLFLNYNASFSMDFDAASCLAGFKPNHIYFSHYVEKKIYSMDSGKVETYSDAIGYSHAGQWFRPNF
ncbi:hypothetical protein BT93_G1149 [Corymbia citriodora subsp. variegata]|nr:hypothetical protein BT93_G1149 [Corymbia citriodora subsp. variegata]